MLAGRIFLAPGFLKLAVALGRAVMLVTLCAIGLWQFAKHPTSMVWLAWFGVAALTYFAPWLSRHYERFRFNARARAAFSKTGVDQHSLVLAAQALRREEHERTFIILENMRTRDRIESERARRWLKAFACVHWMMRQPNPRAISSTHCAYPQLHALIYNSPHIHPVQIRGDLLKIELAGVSTQELDEFARDYIALIDTLVAAVASRRALFHSDAEMMLAYITGRVYMLGAEEHYMLWWSRVRRALVRGGGALLIAVRLVQREHYAEAGTLLDSLSRGGLLSYETDVLQQCTRNLALFSRTHWKMTSSDIPDYFNVGFYYQAIDMGVLRYPNAEMDEVVAACRQGERLRARKKQLINDVLQLWEVFPDDLALPLAIMLKRLTEHKGRVLLTRVDLWREHWESLQGEFEAGAAALMDGIEAASRQQYGNAEKHFRAAQQIMPESTTPLVNLAYVFLKTSRDQEAVQLVERIRREFPLDGQALLSLGRLYALNRDDLQHAESLLLQSLEKLDPPTEALLWLGEVKFMQAAFSESQMYFDQAREIDPELPDAKLGLARIFMETKRYDKAVQNLEAVTRDGSDEARNLAHYLLYRTYRESGDDRMSVRHLNQVTTNFFREPDILDDIAMHLESEKLYAKAREFAERAMMLRATGRLTDDRGDTFSAI